MATPATEVATVVATPVTEWKTKVEFQQWAANEWGINSREANGEWEFLRQSRQAVFWWTPLGLKMKFVDGDIAPNPERRPTYETPEGPRARPY